MKKEFYFYILFLLLMFLQPKLFGNDHHTGNHHGEAKQIHKKSSHEDSHATRNHETTVKNRQIASSNEHTESKVKSSFLVKVKMFFTKITSYFSNVFQNMKQKIAKMKSAKSLEKKVVAVDSLHHESEVNHHVEKTEAIVSVSHEKNPNFRWSTRKSPWTSLKELRRGNIIYKKQNRFVSEDLSTKRQMSAKGNPPKAAILSCSDAAVPPEVIFNQNIGDLYVVRTQGHVLDTASIKSLEYAVKKLGVSLVIVMGHDKCDLIKESLNHKKSKENFDLSFFEDHIKNNISRSNRSPASSITMFQASRAHAFETAKELIQNSAMIKEAWNSEFLVLAVGIYKHGSGKVDFTNLNLTK